MSISQRKPLLGGNTISFNRTLNEYIIGFGDPIHEFWLGLKWIRYLTLIEPYELMISMVDHNGLKYVAFYHSFR